MLQHLCGYGGRCCECVRLCVVKDVMRYSVPGYPNDMFASRHCACRSVNGDVALLD